MLLLVLSIPFMILAIAFAIVPLLVALRRDAALVASTAALDAVAAAPATRDELPVAA